jgi:putative transposase
MPFYDRKTPRLRLGRISCPGGNYFITLCTKKRAPLLNEQDTGTRVIETLLSMHGSDDIELIAATIMPDHAHLLLKLGSRLKLGQTMGKFKTVSRDQGRVAWHWQEDGFEHRVRTDEMIEDYGFYIFMNPYHARLCPWNSAGNGGFAQLRKTFVFFPCWLPGKPCPTSGWDCAMISLPKSPPAIIRRGDKRRPYNLITPYAGYGRAPPSLRMLALNVAIWSGLPSTSSSSLLNNFSSPPGLGIRRPARRMPATCRP